MAKLNSGTRVYGNLTVDANLTITGSILPSANVTYDLGSPTQRFRTGYFSANTIDIGGGTIGLHETLGFTFIAPGGNPQYMMPNGASTSNTFTSSTVTIQGNLAVIGNITTIGNVSGQYILGSGQFLTGLPASYSNINVKAYTESMGFANYSNVNVAAYTTTQSYTNYSNVNLIAYLAGGITSTGFINTSGNVSAAQINSATAVVTGSAFVGELFATSRAGDEGGQLNLANAVTNTTLVGNIVIDVFQNRLRIFESGGTNRGGYFDISGLSASAGTNLAAGGGGGSPGGGQGQIQFNSSSTFAGAASLYYFGANGAVVANAGIASTSTTTGTMQITGGIGVTGNVTADIFNSANNGNGTNFKVGDDVWLGDINIANTLGIKGQQDGTQGYIRFGNVNTNALGVSGSGPLTWGGVLNVTGNILGATGTLSALNVNGLINTTGNILSTGLSVFGNISIGSLAIPGVLHTIIGNIDVSGAGTEYFNIGGNIMAVQASFGSINSTGFINTTANISAAILNSGAINSTGLINTTANISAAILNSGAINSTGFINTSGNVSASQIIASSTLASTIGGLTLISGALYRNGSETQIIGGGGQTTRSMIRLGNSNGMVLYGSGTASAPSTQSTGIIIHGGDGNVQIRAPNTASGGSRIQLQAELVQIQGNLTPVGNLVYDIGNVTNQWNTIYGKSTQAQYADLAEIYTTDQQYPSGTVVVFGGDAEVTQSRASHDTRIAGVVSTDPAYLMNSTATGVPVALQGRVPCRVLGPVSQGDRVVSSHISGVAQRLDIQLYQPGCIIGKALQAIDSADISIIEVVVGRV